MGRGILSRCTVNLFPLGQILSMLSCAYAATSSTSLGSLDWWSDEGRGKRKPTVYVLHSRTGGISSPLASRDGALDLKHVYFSPSFEL